MGYFATAIQEKEDHLEHHGVLGQKWGIRRYQNADGSLTAEGKRRVYAQGANYGGYESFRHRHKRAIDAAKYERDIQKNQKKLDKAYEKGNDKKIAKYTQIDKVLKNNRDIMVKNLSDEQIQMGRDYITMMKATIIGTILAGPIGGVVAGTASRAINKMADNERKVYAQERDREAQYKAEQKINSENAERAKNFDKYVDEHGGKLTTENLPSHDREGKPTYMLTEKQKQKYVDEYNNKRNSFKTDEDKDLWEAQQQATSKKEKDKIIDDRVKLAKKTNQYEMEFLERNLDVDDDTGEQLKGKALDDAYRRYLNEEKSYFSPTMHK